jgi:hypothetical protein
LQNPSSGIGSPPSELQCARKLLRGSAGVKSYERFSRLEPPLRLKGLGLGWRCLGEVIL